MAHILMLLLLLTVSSAPGSAEQAVAQTLDEKIEDIQRRLQSSYDNQDFRVLLAKKESVDSFFLPVFLLFEMQQLPRLDFCRLYRFEYEPGRLRHGLMDKDDVSLLHPCADLRQINAGQCLKFDLAIERYPYVGPDYPIAVHATAFVAATTVDLYFSWYEPCLANRDLDFPIHPECFHVHWDPNEYCLWCKITNEAPARESATTSFPLFNNPAMLYTVFDSLRLQKTLLHDSSYDSLARAPTADGTICLSTDDNRPLRRTRLYRNDEGLPAATIEQYPLILHHQSDTAFQIQRDIGGTTDKVLDFLPRADLNYLGRGRTIDITWYHAASLGDVLFPKTLTVSCRGRELSRINFGPVELVARAAAQGYDGERVSSPEITRMKGLYEQIARKVPIDNPTYYTESELTGDRDGLTLRRRIKYNALAAAYRGDYAVLDYTCRRYRQLFGREVGEDKFVYSVEALTQFAFEYCHLQAGATLCRTWLRQAYQGCDVNMLRGHIIRLVEQYRLGFALVAVMVLDEKVREQGPGEVVTWSRSVQAIIGKLLDGPPTDYEKPPYPYLSQQEKTSEHIYGLLSHRSQP